MINKTSDQNHVSRPFYPEMHVGNSILCFQIVFFYLFLVIGVFTYLFIYSFGHLFTFSSIYHLQKQGLGLGLRQKKE